MFYFLHRLVKWSFVALALAGLYWVWLQREAIEPVYVWYDVYDNGGLMNSERLPVMQGEGTHVFDGNTFQMMSNGKAYKVRLTGFHIPELPMPADEIVRERERRRILRESVLRRPVKVNVTYGENDSLLGIVNAGGTNLNLFFITNSLSNFNPDYIKTLPREFQYQFFAAERMRKKALEKQTELAMNNTGE